MTTTDKQMPMNQRLFRLLFVGNESLTLDEATMKSKAATGDSDVRRAWILFGDPAMRLNQAAEVKSVD